MSQSFSSEIYNKNMIRLKRLVESYYKRHYFKDGTPLVNSFLVTNRCFLKCKHCFYHETIPEKGMIKDSAELTIDDYLKISKSMEWFMIGIFCGGEPFIREDLHEIIKIFRSNNWLPWCDSATNGQLTDEIVRQVELICKQDKDKVYSLSFSLDGFEEFNDEIRGTGTFKRSVETWKECKKLSKIYNNLELNFSSTINSINQDTMDDFLKWGIKELQPNRITLIKTRQSPRDGDYLKEINASNYRKARNIIIDAVKNGLLGDVNAPQTYFMPTISNYIYNTLTTGKRSFMCYAGKHGAWINYNGDVNICEVFPDKNCSEENFKIGNLKDFSMNFIKLWNSEQALKIKQLAGKHPVCEKCTHETEGLIPSLYFEPNNLNHCFDD